MMVPLVFILLVQTCSGHQRSALTSRGRQWQNPQRSPRERRTILNFASVPKSTGNKNKIAPLPFQRIHPNVKHQHLESVHASRWISIRGGHGQKANLPVAPRKMVGFDGISTLVSAIGTESPFLRYNLIMVIANVIGFIVSVVTKGSHIHLDLIGTGAFAVAALPTLLSDSVPLRVKLSSAAVAIWAVKLAGFLFFRACKINKDMRLDDMLSTIPGTFGFWFISALWGIVCSLPHALGAASSVNGNNVALIVGMVMYTSGLAVESIADFQKWTFKQSNPGEFCSVGLWNISQHPNFFGNFLLWSGIFVMNVPALLPMLESEGASGGAVLSNVLSSVWAWRLVGLAMLSPLFLLTLFSGQASGTIGTALEQSAKRYGADPKYAEYIKSVPLIFPWKVFTKLWK